MDDSLYTQHACALGQRVVLLREQHGLTQEALAAAMGWTQPAISRLERGRQTISLRQLVRLAKALDVDLVVLLWGTLPAPGPVLRPELDALVREAAQLDRSLLPPVTRLLAEVRRIQGRQGEVVEQQQE